MSQTAPRPPRLAGFTLTELLIVVVIIAVLVAISIPTALRVRQSARQTTNVSNIRQLTLANVAYHDENRHFASGNDWVGGIRSWAQRVGPYCGVTPELFKDNQRPPGIFAFPDPHAKKGDANDSGSQLVRSSSSGSFSFYSRNGTIYVNDSSLASNQSVRTLSRVSDPARLYLITDWGHWDSGQINSTSRFPGYFGGKYTFGFVDGHVTTYKAGQIPTPANKPAFWNARIE